MPSPCFSNDQLCNRMSAKDNSSEHVTKKRTVHRCTGTPPPLPATKTKTDQQGHPHKCFVPAGMDRLVLLTRHGDENHLLTATLSSSYQISGRVWTQYFSAKSKLCVQFVKQGSCVKKTLVSVFLLRSPFTLTAHTQPVTPEEEFQIKMWPRKKSYRVRVRNPDLM